MPIQWPETLPQVPQKGFTESVGVVIIRSQTDLGPAKQRVRGKRPTELNLTFILTTEQTTELESFIKNTISGVMPFQFTHPRTQTLVDVRIVPNNSEFYQLQYIAPGYWNATLKFEVLP